MNFKLGLIYLNLPNDKTGCDLYGHDGFADDPQRKPSTHGRYISAW